MKSIFGLKALSAISSVTVFIFLSFLLVGCWGGSSRSSGSSGDTPGNSSSTCTSGSSLEQDLSGMGCFVVSGNTVSFIIHAFSSSASTPVFSSLTAPDGSDIKARLSQYGGTGIPWESAGYSNVLIPLSSAYQSTAGNWSYTVSSATSLQLTSRTGSVFSTPTIIVQPYLTGDNYTADNISAALSIMKGIYEQNGISLSIQTTIPISGTQYGIVSKDFTDPETAELVKRGSSDKVNLFFLQGYKSEGYLGNSAGIPGSQGVQSGHNGVLISLKAHELEANGVLHDQLLGETVGHEMGHFLGLYHTSESSGEIFDPISDTPECPASKANKTVTAENCDDGNNVMFWKAYTPNSMNAGKKQNQFTSGQVYVLQHAPIAN